MHSQYAQSHTSNDVGEGQNQHLTMFQKYSKLSPQGQQTVNHAENPHDEQHYLEGHFPDMQEITPISENRVTDSNVQPVSEEGHHHHSLVDSVAKEESVKGLQFLMDVDHHDLSGVAQASSKIIHQPISRHQIIPAQQYYQQYPQQMLVNTSAAMNPQRVMNQTTGHMPPNPQNIQQQQNNLRHTISSTNNRISPGNGPVSTQQSVMRGSLPSGMNSQQLLMKQGANQQNYGHAQQQLPTQQQVFNQQQFKVIPSSPHYHPSQIPSQSLNASQPIHPQQVNRLPNHIPQSLVPVQTIQSQTFVETVNFIKNGPQRLETSEIVYKSRNPKFVNQLQQQPQHGSVIVQRQQNVVNQQVVERRGSVEDVRSHTRSLERKKTNVVFNYNSSQQGSQQKQSIPISEQPSRPASFSPVPVNTVQPQILPRPVVLSPPPQNIQKAPIPVQSLATQVQSNQQIEVQTNWKQRYFGLYSRFETVNKKVEFINEEFYIYEKVIQSVQEQKIIKRHKKIVSVIQELQQECVSILHEWKPTSQVKSIQAQTVTKDSSHLEMKYKRLLFNYSKVQEQNETFKKAFEQKIHEVVKRLETQNSELKNKLNQLSIQKSQQSAVQQSDDLTLSESLKLELEESIARYHHENRMLHDEIERLNEINGQLVERIRGLQRQAENHQCNQVSSQQVEGEKRIGMENIENIIEELNQKIVQYQLRLSTVQDQNQRLQQLNTQLNQRLQTSTVNHASPSNNASKQLIQVQQQLQSKSQQLEQVLSNYSNIEQNNFMMSYELENMAKKISE